MLDGPEPRRVFYIARRACERDEDPAKPLIWKWQQIQRRHGEIGVD